MLQNTAKRPAPRASAAPYFRGRPWASRIREILDFRPREGETVTGGSLRRGLVSPGMCEGTDEHQYGLRPVSDTTIRTRNITCGHRLLRRLAQILYFPIPFSAIRGRHQERDTMESIRSQ